MRTTSFHFTLNITIGLLFILSAFAKALTMNVFAGEVVQYLINYFCGWLSDYNMYIAGFVCLTELLVGMSFLISSFRSELRNLKFYTNLVSFVMLTFFVFLTGENYFFPGILGRIESCGCFGDILHFTPFASFIKSCLVWCMVVICIVTSPNKCLLDKTSNIDINKK